jgi:hypothetical protein
MEDVTRYFDNYRECIRHLWNTYYRSLPETCREWDLNDEFEDVAVAIFSSIVLRPLGVFDQKLSAKYLAEPLPLPGFTVVPILGHGTPIMINRDLPRSGYWDHPVTSIKPRDAEMNYPAASCGVSEKPKLFSM